MTALLDQFRSETGSRRPLIITGCSSSKRISPDITGDGIERNAQSLVSTKWLERVSAAKPVCRAADLYKGRAFALAMRASERIGADVAILSAGLGVVMADTKIPSYDLTLARGGIRDRVIGKFDVASWWRAVSRGPYSADIDALLSGRGLVLACITRAYAPFITEDLEKHQDETDIRIFGKGLNGVLSERLAGVLMPYDDRLTVLNAGGTQGDFAQRALHHYITEIRALACDSVEEDTKAVKAAFLSVSKPTPIPKRTPATDDTLRTIIARLLKTVGPRRSPMLRYLRDREGVACEQSRFARIFAEVMQH